MKNKCLQTKQIERLEESNFMLSPSQQQTAERVMRNVSSTSVILLKVPSEFGGSRIANYLGRKLHARVLTVSDFLKATLNIDPMAVYQSILGLILNTIQDNQTVIIDDFCLVEGAFSTDYPATGLIFLLSEALVLEEYKKKSIILVNSNQFIGGKVTLKEFTLEDYEYFFSYFLDKKAAARLDLRRIYKSVAFLNVRQIRNACKEVSIKSEISTDSLIEYLQDKGLISNVDREEVEKISFFDIKGIDHIVESLERHVIFPFNHGELSSTFKFQPVRGIVLHGPPGTGKTSIGRALAHRLGGKFFLIDGNFIASSHHFMDDVREIFERAKRNAPAVIFVDDFDTLFEFGTRQDLYRFLLSELDGLENNKKGEVCIVLTVMDVEKLPKALLRFGRLELWLEIPLPNQNVRYEILSTRIKNLPEPLCSADIVCVAKSTEGFTGADLRSLVETAKRIYGYDKINRQSVLASDDYFHLALTSMIEQKRKSQSLSIGFSNGS